MLWIYTSSETWINKAEIQLFGYQESEGANKSNIEKFAFKDEIKFWYIYGRKYQNIFMEHDCYLISK